MEAATQTRSKVERVRRSPRLVTAIALSVILVLAWLGWAVYVATEKGIREGLGVLIAWPAILAAAALVALPFLLAAALVRGGARR